MYNYLVLHEPEFSTLLLWLLYLRGGRHDLVNSHCSMLCEVLLKLKKKSNDIMPSVAKKETFLRLI